MHCNNVHTHKYKQRQYIDIVFGIRHIHVKRHENRTINFAVTRRYPDRPHNKQRIKLKLKLASQDELTINTEA